MNDYARMLKYLRKMYDSGKREVYLASISEGTNINREEVQILIPELLRDGLLKIEFEVICVNCNYVHSTYEKYENVPNEEITCMECSTEYRSSLPESISVIFTLSNKLKGAVDKEFFRNKATHLGL